MNMMLFFGFVIVSLVMNVFRILIIIFVKGNCGMYLLLRNGWCF